MGTRGGDTPRGDEAGRSQPGGTFPDRLAAVNRAVALVLFAALTVVVALQVIARFILHAPMIWSEEAARFLFFWLVLLGSAMGVRDRRHFVIDFTIGRAPQAGTKRRLLLDIVPDACVLAFSVFLLVHGILYTEVGLLRVATNSQVNMALVYAAIPAFAALSLLYSVSNIVLDCVRFRSRQ